MSYLSLGYFSAIHEIECWQTVKYTTITLSRERDEG